MIPDVRALTLMQLYIESSIMMMIADDNASNVTLGRAGAYARLSGAFRYSHHSQLKARHCFRSMNVWQAYARHRQAEAIQDCDFPKQYIPLSNKIEVHAQGKHGKYRSTQYQSP